MTQTLPRRAPRRARSYLWHLLLLIPAVAMIVYGLHRHRTFDPGGTVNAVKLTTKGGMVGQAAEAVANVEPGTPDLYLKVVIGGAEFTLPAKKDTPIGNGLTWDLPSQYSLGDVNRVEVWDHNTMWKDKQIDRITMNGWVSAGQLFQIELMGKRNQPPAWAMPLASAGAAIALLVLLKFVWDQVV